MISRHKKYININAYGACYGGNWLHILLKMSGSFGCVVTSKQCSRPLMISPYSQLFSLIWQVSMLVSLLRRKNCMTFYRRFYYIIDKAGLFIDKSYVSNKITQYVFFKSGALCYCRLPKYCRESPSGRISQNNRTFFKFTDFNW